MVNFCSQQLGINNLCNNNFKTTLFSPKFQDTLGYFKCSIHRNFEFDNSIPFLLIIYYNRIRRSGEQVAEGHHAEQGHPGGIGG